MRPSENQRMKTGILLTNLGTPDSFSTPDVRKYLKEFLMDGRVIDIPFFPRFLLVNGIIAPFRAPKSAKVYQKVWLEEGSPLKVYGERLKEKVQEKLGDQFVVELAMRYQSPSIREGLEKLTQNLVSKIVVVPLFPQYASATSGSIVEKVMDELRSNQLFPEIQMTGPFYQENFFIQLLGKNLKEQWNSISYDQVLFSYHGLPERHIRKGDSHGNCLKENCCQAISGHNQFCYRAQCFATSNLLAKEAGLLTQQYSTSFQSRLGNDPWIKPYTEELIKSWPENGIKRVLALSPSFVADCLETTEEIGMEYKEVFLKAGGEEWTLMPCLNDDEDWATGLAGWIKNKST